MTFYTVKRLILSPTELHILCAATAVLSTLPILFPEVSPPRHAELVCHYAGICLMASICLSTFLMLTAISNLFGIGGASMIAHSLGKKDMQSAKEISSTSFWMSILSASLFSCFFFI